MKVLAKFAANKFGFYGGKRRYDKDEFVLESAAHFSDRWMERCEPGEKTGTGRKAGKSGGGLFLKPETLCEGEGAE
jgi:hypothetical protein